MDSTANIPFTDFGGVGELLHFAHANGYPAGGYRQLFDALMSDYHIQAMSLRALWDEDHQQLRSWDLFSHDLISFMDQNDMKQAIGMGHSMGGVATMIAAVQQPELFKKIVLIDPVIMPWTFRLFQLLPLSIQMKFNPMAKVSSKRRDRWESKEAVYESWRTKRVFKRIEDEGLRHFVDAALQPMPEGGVGLAFSKEWETQIYTTGVNTWHYLKRLSIPTLIIRADKSNVLVDPTWEKMQKVAPNVDYLTIPDSTHLVPLEKPKEVAQHILDWLK